MFEISAPVMTVLALHLAIVAVCVWHLTKRTGYNEERLHMILPLVLFLPGAGILYLMSAKAGTVPPDTTKTGSSSRHFEHRLGFRDGKRSKWGFPQRKR
ncbi:penicillin-binding protein [Rothia dentocariosa]|uniref:penicillin-binding protein n=1 Tax=Rothia dentocariosa TaxID=2047 RepID=UPI002448324D|nr:penicillin-binding protein [Rothia dentocariosa]